MSTLGMIDLERYLAKSSYNNIKSKFYIYDKLYTYNFEKFKDLQLNNPYGKQSYFKMVETLVDQGLIELCDLKKIASSQTVPSKEMIQLYSVLAETHESYWEGINSLRESSNDQAKSERLVSVGADILSLRERIFGKLLEETIQAPIYPVSSINSYGNYQLKTSKADVYTILIGQIPIPDDSVPLVDIIQYKNDPKNKLNFLKMKTWANKFSHTGLNMNEINEEISCLIEENRHEMKLAGIKSSTTKLQIVIKILPELVENLLKLNLSKLLDPFFELRRERVSLLETEMKAKGNELTYIINAMK